MLFSRRYSSSDDGSPYDMVIAGGGMVGTALACCIGEGERERERERERWKHRSECHSV